MPAQTALLLLSGSLRAGSTNTAALRTIGAIAPGEVSVDLYDGMAALPQFNPDDDADGVALPAAVADLRARIAAADAIVVSTPEYAGALPGSFKNLLDWTIGGGEVYGKPVAWINVSGVAAPTGGADAHDSLLKVLTYAGTAVVEAACRRIAVSRADVGDNGLIATPEVRDAIVSALDALLAALR